MTADRAVMIGCAALLAALVFADQREGAQAQRDARGDNQRVIRDESLPASPPTHTDLLVALMNEGCIEWTDLDERRWMTCGDTVPAVQVVSYQLRYVP